MGLRHIQTVAKGSREPNTSITIAKKPKNEGRCKYNFTIFLYREHVFNTYNDTQTWLYIPQGSLRNGNAFWVIFQVALCSLYFCSFQKKVLDPNAPYIEMFQIILRNGCLSVILEFCLLWYVVCCLLSAIFTKNKVYYRKLS